MKQQKALTLRLNIVFMFIQILSLIRCACSDLKLVFIDKNFKLHFRKENNMSYPKGLMYIKQRLSQHVHISIFPKSWHGRQNLLYNTIKPLLGIFHFKKCIHTIFSNNFILKKMLFSYQVIFYIYPQHKQKINTKNIDKIQLTQVEDKYKKYR